MYETLAANFAYPERRVQVGWLRAPMTSGELTEWMAFEQLHGPILAHERIDIGLAQVSTIMANAWGRKRYKLREFLPAWWREATRKSAEDVDASFEALLRSASANDQHANR